MPPLGSKMVALLEFCWTPFSLGNVNKGTSGYWVVQCTTQANHKSEKLFGS